MSSVVSAFNLSLSYNNSENEIIKKATFDIKKGEFVFITGLSGSGKSTLLKALYGELNPREGDLIVGGLDLNTIEKKNFKS